MKITELERLHSPLMRAIRRHGHRADSLHEVENEINQLFCHFLGQTSLVTRLPPECRPERAAEIIEQNIVSRLRSILERLAENRDANGWPTDESAPLELAAVVLLQAALVTVEVLRGGPINPTYRQMLEAMTSPAESTIPA